MWLHSVMVAQLLRSAACLHTNQSRSYLDHLVFAEFHSILTRWSNIFSHLLNVHGVVGVKQTEIHTAEPPVPEPSVLILRWLLKS